MELLVRTLHGSIVLQGVDETASIAQIKHMLHETHKEGPMAVPEPDLQRLVRARRWRRGEGEWGFRHA